MKGTLLVFACLFLSGCVNSFVSTGASALYNHNRWQHTFSDYYTLLQVRRNLDRDAKFNQTSISVTSFNHIVLLTGEVPSAPLQQRAGNIASQVDGVKRVFNAISVGTPLSTAQIAKDTWITAVIKSKMIASNDIDPDKIKIVTENSVVYLLGIVPRKEADIATLLAQDTHGVKKVVCIFYYVIMPEID